MSKSPLSLVKDKFKDKDGLIEAVRALATSDLWVDRINSNKGLEHVSNRKLLHLHEVLSQVKSRFGTRGELIKAVLKLEKREKDEGFQTRLERYPTPRLWDRYRALEKRAL